MLKIKNKKICPAYVSKYNSNRKKQVLFLIIPDRERWHCNEVKKLSALLRRITSKNNGNFYCLSSFHSFGTKKNLNHVKKYVEIKIFLMLKCLLSTKRY